MPIFSRHQNKLTSINELNPKSYKESDLQRLAEANLEAVFGLIFVTTEFQLNGLRVDTLAFDAEAKAFVIIEYKRDHSFSVVDQGYAYLSLMLNHKADFILEYNEHMSKHLGKTDVDWSQSRVIFVANSFTTYQQQAINFRDLPMELWEAKYYSNDTVLFNRLKTPDSSESINTISKKSQTINEVSKEVKKYTVADHFTGAKAEWLPIYEELCDRLMMIDERIKENPRSGHIGLALGENGASTVIYIKPHNQKMTIEIPSIRPEDVDIMDPDGRITYMPNSFEHYNTPVSRFDIRNSDDVYYILPTIQWVMKRFGKWKS